LVAELIGGEQPAIRQSRALLLEIQDASNARLQGTSDGIEELLQRWAKRDFGDRGTGRADFFQIDQIFFKQVSPGPGIGLFQGLCGRSPFRHGESCV
jgi:hypothetical protein